MSGIFEGQYSAAKDSCEAIADHLLYPKTKRLPNVASKK